MMEKSTYERYLTATTVPRESGRFRHPPRWLKSLLILVGLLYLVCSKLDLSAPRIMQEWPQYLYNKNGTIKWTKCDASAIYCTELLVPLSYLPDDGRTVKISLALRPDVTSKRGVLDLKHAIWVNPGGPGGSGVAFMYRKDIYSMYESFSGARSIISFDPRGINSSTTFNCFGSDQARVRAHAEAGGATMLGHDNLALQYASHSITAQGCAAHSPAIGPYISTSYVARDMRYMSSLLTDLAEEKVALDYFGFSYGSVLGMHYAALYPDNVRNMIVDGVCDLDDYLAGQWRSNLHNTDDVYQHFLTSCIDHPGKCALAKDSSGALRSVETLRTDIDQVFTSLLNAPQPLWSARAEEGRILTAGAFERELFSGLYAADGWPKLASIIADYLNGNITALSERLIPESRTLQTDEGGLATACGDASSQHDWTNRSSVENSMQAISETLSFLKNQTSLGAEYWAAIPTRCQYYPFRPQTLYDVIGSGARNYEGSNILFTNNEYDIVTPLRNAQKMSERFRNSKLLQIDESYGHCSWTMPSTCAKKIQKAWLSGQRNISDITHCGIDAGSGAFEQNNVDESEDHSGIAKFI